MKHKTLLLFFFLLIWSFAQATTQVRDLLYWKGVKYYTIPIQIEKHFSKIEVNNLEKLGENWTSTANYRAYRFIFEIENDSLFLKAIVNDEEENITESILGSQERRMMDNFSDTLFLGYGESVYDPAFWTLVYESEITVAFKNGVVQWFKDNRNKSVESRYFDNRAVIKKLYSNIRWSSLDKETLQKKPRVVLGIENDSLDKIEKLTILRSSGFPEFDEEAVRVIQTIPCLGVSFVKGKYIHHSYQVPIVFDADEAQEMGINIESRSNNHHEDRLSQILEECIIKSKNEYDSWNNKKSRLLLLCCDGLPVTYLEQNESFYKNIGLETFSWYNNREFEEERKEGIDVIEVHYYLEGNTIVVYVNFSTATQEGNEILQAYWFEDVNKYVYEYSCETNEWKLIKEE